MAEERRGTEPPETHDFPTKGGGNSIVIPCENQQGGSGRCEPCGTFRLIIRNRPGSGDQSGVRSSRKPQVSTRNTTFPRPSKKNS